MASKGQKQKQRAAKEAQEQARRDAEVARLRILTAVTYRPPAPKRWVPWSHRPHRRSWVRHGYASRYSAARLRNDRDADAVDFDDT